MACPSRSASHLTFTALIKLAVPRARVNQAFFVVCVPYEKRAECISENYRS